MFGNRNLSCPSKSPNSKFLQSVCVCCVWEGGFLYYDRETEDSRDMGRGARRGRAGHLDHTHVAGKGGQPNQLRPGLHQSHMHEKGFEGWRWNSQVDLIGHKKQLQDSRHSCLSSRKELPQTSRGRMLSQACPGQDNCECTGRKLVDGSLPIEEFNIEIEDQSEHIVHLGYETDQRAVMIGVMCHAKGKRLIRQGNYKDRLESLKQFETLAWILDVLKGINTYIEQRFDQIDINTRLEALEDCHPVDGGRVVRQGNYKDGLELLKPSETLARILAVLEELRTYIEKRFDQVDINLAEMNARIKALEDRLAAEK